MTEEIINDDKKIKADVLGKTVESLVITPYGFNGKKESINFNSLSGTIQEKYWWNHFLGEDKQNRQSIDKDILHGTGCLFRTLGVQLTTQSGLIYEMELSAIQTGEYIKYKERLASENLSIDSVVTSLEPYQNSNSETNFTSINFTNLSNYDAIIVSKTFTSHEAQPVSPDSFIKSSLECCVCGSHSGLFFIKKRDNDYTEYKCCTCNTIILICSLPWDETPGNIPTCKQCGNENGSAYVVYSASNMFEHFCSICHEDLDHSRHALMNRSYVLNKQLLGKNLCGWEDL